MPKIRHSLTINTFGTEFNKFVYDFGQTKGVELIIAETGIQITAELTKSFDPLEMLCGDSYLFADGINKALLLYLIRFSRTLKIDALTLRIDNEEEIILLGQNADPPIYSMINGTLHRPIPAEFSGEVITEQLLKMTKSKYDKRVAALYALLLSKSKRYETERFIYLWTSLNGMYSWISEIVAEANGVEKYRKEYKQIIAFQQFIDVGSCTIAEKDKAPIAHNIWREIKNLCVQAGANPQKVFPHNLHHLFARTFYGIEKDIAKFADILGHSSINTTRIYIITTGNEHRQRMENMRLII